MTYPYPELKRGEVEALGIQTSFLSAGEAAAPLVLLLHGMSSAADVYREVMHELSDNFRLVAPDIPGFGLSEQAAPYTLQHLVEWLAAFRAALALPQMILIGHSFGGALATQYTVSYSQDVSRLLLVAPAILAGELVPEFLKRVGIALGLVELSGALSQSPAFAESQSGRPFYDPSKIDASVWPRRRQYIEQSRASGDVLKALAFHDMKAELGRIEQPVCLIWGKEDPVLPARQAEELALAIPSAAVEIWGETGHLPFLEQLERFVLTAREFLGR